MTLLSYIILLTVVCTIAAILDHVSGMDKPKKKPCKPKKMTPDPSGWGTPHGF